MCSCPPILRERELHPWHYRIYVKQGVALTGRNHTGPPCRVTVDWRAAWRHSLACAAEAACRPAVECYRHRQTTTTDAKLYWPIRRASNKKKLTPNGKSSYWVFVEKRHELRINESVRVVECSRRLVHRRSEWVSSFFTAHKHNLGHLVPLQVKNQERKSNNITKWKQLTRIH